MTKPRAPSRTMLAPALGMRATQPTVETSTPPARATPTLDLDVIAREAAALAPGPFGFFLWANERRISAGLHRISDWWLSTLRAFYASGKPFGIFLVGRGGGKSTTLEAVAAVDSLFVPRAVPSGQTWTWPFISVGPDDANRRIDGIAAVFRALGLTIIGDEDEEGAKAKKGVKVVHSPRASAKLVDARGNPIMLASIAGTVGNASGPSTIGCTVDEAAKLYDKGTHANPLTEILGSLAETSRARAGWRAIVCSSAWRDGTHFQIVKAGDNETNFIARIGTEHIDAAKRGFELVAAWEAAGDVATGRAANPAAAARIRAHAATLTADSPMVPTWVANPTLGHPESKPWDGAAVASRKLVQVLPPDSDALDGLTREEFWLRENGSVPHVGGERSTLSVEDIAACASFNREPAPRGRPMGLRPDGLLHVPGYNSAGRPGAEPARRRGL